MTEANSPASHSRRRLLLGSATLVFIAAGAAWGFYWATYARYQVSTDDAYVAGNVIAVTPQVAGTVIKLYADDTDRVETGAPLVRLDDADARIGLARAEAELAQAVREVRTAFSNDDALAAQVSLRRTLLDQARADFARRSRLADTGAVSAEELKHARDAVEGAAAELTAAEKQWEANRAATDGTTVATHPKVLAAEAALRDVYLAWRRTRVPAPLAGEVAQRTVQIGQRVTPGVPMMAVVPLDQVWVDANFKEGQLRHMRVGQPAMLTADVYGGGVVYHGKVVGLAAGTGAAFSLLPAQNATGNWIKVVQRVPVRISLDPAELAAHPLRIGLSINAEVNVADEGGAPLEAAERTAPVAETKVFADLDRDAAKLISAIVAANSGAGAAE